MAKFINYAATLKKKQNTYTGLVNYIFKLYILKETCEYLKLK